MAEINEMETITNDKLEFIRDQLRDKINLTRKEQRYVKINQKRTVLGQLDNHQNTIEFVAEAATNLKKKSLDIHEYRKLQNALIQSENHVNAFFKVNNSIQGLSRDLSGKSIQSKLAAANCCCNLALGNSKACIKLCKFVAPYLIVNLESISEPLVEVCAWTIGNIVNENKSVFNILHAQGCLKLLINLIHQSSESLLPAIGYACLRYIYTGNDSIDVSDIVKICEALILRYSIISDIDTMWLLAILSSKADCNKILMKCIAPICSYFYEAILTEDKNIKKILAVFRIISNTISEPSGEVAFCLFNNEIERNSTFIKKLLFHQCIYIRQNTLWMLGNLYNHNLECVQQIIKNVFSVSPCLKLAVNSIAQAYKSMNFLEASFAYKGTSSMHTG